MSRENLVLCKPLTALRRKVAEECVRAGVGLKWACQSFYESCDCRVSASLAVMQKN
jgi:hypothetical protein